MPHGALAMVHMRCCSMLKHHHFKSSIQFLLAGNRISVMELIIVHDSGRWRRQHSMCCIVERYPWP